MTPDPAPYVITLGTAGGPRWWFRPGAGARSGIATALVVGDRWYLIDAGQQAFRQAAAAGLDFNELGGVFLTHLHSDHVCDLASLALFGLYLRGHAGGPVRILGPGDRGMLPPVSDRADTTPTPVAPRHPTPGTRDLFDLLCRAYATDLNDRVLDSMRHSPLDLFRATDIELPDETGASPNERVAPTMSPFPVFEDDRIRVQATLVEHPPVFPAFGFRIDTEGGSVTISGDTAPTDNVVTLAADTDLLLHEAIDFSWVDELYADRNDELSAASRDHHHKSHTSPEQAIKLAESAGARQLALHHLVPGFPGEDRWHALATGHGRRPLIPDDLTTVPLNA